MNYPTYVHTVTVYHAVTSVVNGRRTTSWTRTVVPDCWFGREARRTVDGAVLKDTDAFIVRIPLGAARLSKGDVVVGAEVTDAIPDNTGAGDLLAKYAGNAFAVDTVRVNDCPLLPYPHVKGAQA